MYGSLVGPRSDPVGALGGAAAPGEGGVPADHVHQLTVDLERHGEVEPWYSVHLYRTVGQKVL